MRTLIAAPILGLLLLGACSEPQYLLSERIDPIARPSSLNGVTTQIVSLRIGNGFTGEEQARIVAAVAEWNRRGPVQFDLAPRTAAGTEPGTWTIMKRDPAAIATTDEWKAAPIAVTQRSAVGGGAIVVDVNRLGPRDLSGVIVAELGVAVGA